MIPERILDPPRHGSAGECALQEAYGTGARADRFYADQMLDHLNPRMREFVARQEMLFVATADARGECDCTFRAGAPGFIRTLDERRVTYPEYRGNGVLASLGNIHESGHIGLLMVDFFRDLIGLHVNGRASIVDNDTMRRRYGVGEEGTIPGRRPERWVLVDIEEAYIHCSKHIPRLVPLPRRRAWGSDDSRHKGGDYFGAAASRARDNRDGPP